MAYALSINFKRLLNVIRPNLKTKVNLSFLEYLSAMSSYKISQRVTYCDALQA